MNERIRKQTIVVVAEILRAPCVPGTVPAASSKVTHLFPCRTEGRFRYYARFKGEETERQQRRVVCPRSHPAGNSKNGDGLEQSASRMCIPDPYTIPSLFLTLSPMSVVVSARYVAEIAKSGG